MEAATRTTDKIFVNQEILKKLVEIEKQRRREEYLRKIEEQFQCLQEKFYEIVENEAWVKIANKDLYYVNKFNFLIVDPTRYSCSDEVYELNMDEFRGRPLNKEEAFELFFNSTISNPLVKQSNKGGCYIEKLGGNRYCNVACSKNSRYSSGTILGNISLNSGEFFENYSSSFVGIKLPVFDCEGKISKFKNFIMLNLIPDGFSEEDTMVFHKLIDLHSKNYIAIEEGTTSFAMEQYKSEIFEGKFDELDGISFREQDILDHIRTSKMELTDEIKTLFLSEYLNCDYRRAEIEPYDQKILEDPNRGHWDLWKLENKDGISISTNTMFVGRNPLADIRTDGMIGIDFGTKSTVVVYQDGDSHTLPMRVGSGKYKKEVKKEDFENPTVMEFRNLEKFMECYKAKEGRPNTLWEDLTVSHKAAEQLKNSNDSSKYYSFFSDLKQWSGDRTRQIRVRDNYGYERVLPAFVDLQEDEFNPIELYAYYLGLFINNMYRGIYLNYVLSFPVTYEKRVRENIIKSFEKGIRKSLPEEVLEDEEVMKKFRVLQGVSEPAAYAICALQEYHFEPDEEHSYFYGIFDFGGGTTDFDFGIWRCATDAEARRYDYVIEHFGAGGDPYLGGENLLELLAFHVFKENRDKLIPAAITFYKPYECKEFAGSEMLLSNSQEAKLNTRQLMEKLRGLWQNDNEEDVKAIEEGKIKLLLFTNTGKPEANFELMVKKEELIQILTERIEKGVKNFFDALKLNFSRDDLGKVDRIHIFLAGNSSKSPIVQELFHKYIEERTEEILKYLEGEEAHTFFTVYPSLGTEEARKIQKERGYEPEENELTRPTGKTGVAYGLIEGRPGSRIKVISEIKATDEVKFKYYIGYESKKAFRVVIDREIEYQKWVYFIDASEVDFEFYYTSLPEATTNQLPIGEVHKKICRIEEANEEANVYIRVVEPTVIEYGVATEDGIKNNEIMGKIERVELT